MLLNPLSKESRVSTADTPNRIQDKTRVEQRGLPEEGNTTTSFFTKKGTLVATGYTRIVYGDHGPYVEFKPQHMIRAAWKNGRPKSDAAYYLECWPCDGSKCLLYVQKRTVAHLPNPPSGQYSCNNNRPEGYADYKVGMLYISPDNLDWRHNA